MYGILRFPYRGLYLVFHIVKRKIICKEIKTSS
jgi:hypothetical protein